MGGRMEKLLDQQFMLFILVTKTKSTNIKIYTIKIHINLHENQK